MAASGEGRVSGLPSLLASSSTGSSCHPNVSGNQETEETRRNLEDLSPPLPPKTVGRQGTFPGLPGRGAGRQAGGRREHAGKTRPGGPGDGRGIPGQAGSRPGRSGESPG